MEVCVPFTVPVIAHVDTETGRVVRVVTVDEEIQPTIQQPYTQPNLTPVDDETAKLVIDIAESAEWPAWDTP